jgi:hypothetical protein
MKKLACAALVLGFLAGCSSMNINTDFAYEADFSQYKTFAYQDTDMSVADTQPLAHERIVGAIKRELQGKGFTEATSNPDIYVTYYGEDKEQIALDTTHMGYGYGPGWGWGGGFGSSTTTVRSYTQGTLVVDMWDAEAKQLVWRGVISDTLSDNPQKNIEKMNKGMAKIFERYPPTPGS